METVGKQRLQHQRELLRPGLWRRFCSNIEAVEFQPVRTADSRLGLETVSESDEVEHRNLPEIVAAPAKKSARPVGLWIRSTGAALNFRDYESRTFRSRLRRRHPAECKHRDPNRHAIASVEPIHKGTPRIIDCLCCGHTVPVAIVPRCRLLSEIRYSRLVTQRLPTFSAAKEYSALLVDTLSAEAKERGSSFAAGRSMRSTVYTGKMSSCRFSSRPSLPRTEKIVGRPTMAFAPGVLFGGGGISQTALPSLELERLDLVVPELCSKG